MRLRRIALLALGTFLLATIVVLLLVLVVVAWPLPPPPALTPSEAFRAYVADPIPPSVTDMKTEYVGRRRSLRVAIHFRLSSADLPMILSTREYVRVDGIPSQRQAFVEDVFPYFIRPGWPHPAHIAQPEMYMLAPSVSSLSPLDAYMLTGPDHTEVYFYYTSR